MYLNDVKHSKIHERIGHVLYHVTALPLLRFGIVSADPGTQGALTPTATAAMVAWTAGAAAAVVAREA